MTAFADHLDLRTAVLEAAGGTDTVDVFDRHLRLAEAHLNRQLRLSEQIAQTPLTVFGGEAALPADYLEAIGLTDNCKRELVAQPIMGFEAGYWDRYQYAIENAKLRGQDGVYIFDYFTKIPTIAGDITASNWLLQKYPEVYLYAVGFEVSKQLRDTEGMGIARAMRDEAINDACADDERARYSRARVRVVGVTP